jgi:hypothetical protein
MKSAPKFPSHGFCGVIFVLTLIFRASSGQGASKALKDLSQDAGLPNFGFGWFLFISF